jgi:hypothetical protein
MQKTEGIGEHHHSSKKETVPLVHSFSVPGLLRCLHKKPCRRLAMTGGGLGRVWGWAECRDSFRF